MRIPDWSGARATRAWLAAATLALALAPGAAGAAVVVEIQSPRPGERVENRVDQAPIRGTATADGERPRDFDVMIVLDVSASTRYPSGIDVDGDGQVGVNPQLELIPGYPGDVENTDPDDSILHAEAAAARALVRSLDTSR